MGVLRRRAYYFGSMLRLLILGSSHMSNAFRFSPSKKLDARCIHTRSQSDLSGCNYQNDNDYGCHSLRM